MFIWSVAHHPSRCYLIYLTNQMLIIEVVYLAFAAYTTGVGVLPGTPDANALVREGDVGPPGPDALRVVSRLPAVLDIHLRRRGAALDHALHARLQLLAIIKPAMAVDQLLTNQPVRPWHFVYFIGYAVLYLIWSCHIQLFGPAMRRRATTSYAANHSFEIGRNSKKHRSDGGNHTFGRVPAGVRQSAVCCGRRTPVRVENDDLNRIRASAMSIELVRRRSSINYDNLPSIECSRWGLRNHLASCKTLASEQNLDERSLDRRAAQALRWTRIAPNRSSQRCADDVGWILCRAGPSHEVLSL